MRYLKQNFKILPNEHPGDIVREYQLQDLDVLTLSRPLVDLDLPYKFPLHE